jgi:MarR family 2-MHQ and catechol resistance regulon transcriptional repressor
MPKRSGLICRNSLAAQMARQESQPSLVLAKAVIRVAFLLTNGPDRPFQALGLNVSQVDVLAALARAEDASLNCSEIAEATLITKGGITGILDRLEARGLIQRVPSREDRRSIRIELTEKGIELWSGLFPRLSRDDEAIFARALKPEQIKQLSKLLTLLVRGLEAGSQIPRIPRMGASEPTHGHQRI